VVNAMTRNDIVVCNDDAAGASVLGEPDKPSPLAADAAEKPSPAIDPDLLEAIESKIDELTARLDRYERRMAADAALAALEDEIERMYPPSPDDDGDLMLN
jgi:hypothetical protein